MDKPIGQISVYPWTELYRLFVTDFQTLLATGRFLQAGGVVRPLPWDSLKPAMQIDLQQLSR